MQTAPEKKISGEEIQSFSHLEFHSIANSGLKYREVSHFRIENMHKSGLLVLVLLGLTGFHHGAEAEQEDQHVVELVRSMINEATDPLNTSAVVTLDQKQMPCLYKSRVVSDPDTNKDEDPGKQLVSHARSLLIGTMRGIIVALHPDSALPDCEHLMTSDKVKGDESAKPVPNVVVIENQTESLQVMDDNPDVMYLSANDSLSKAWAFMQE
ncbi:unnamed protein product [Notodromas monacha]|uniref:Uncharacterized protein n=1 Tax=Notodromas monacha TaxID=399045 RepID=A0A7R9BRC9_9CRUS|nr:unnamed protein product [Notodromas monacha]CAG0919939.1 unnamed protein product [Notodromas monacha]